MAVKAPLNFPGRHFALSPPRFSISLNPPHHRLTGGTNSLKPPLCIRAGYTRKPTGTPGAYHLIDEETGEKFIVWGGLENDDDAPIPSDQVLSWKPRTHPKKQTNRVGGEAVEVPTVDSSSNDSTPRNTILAPSFGRLKAQRVKALIKRSPKVRQQNFRDFQQSGDMSPLDDTTDTSFSEVDLLERKKNSGSLAAYKGKMSRAATQLPKAKDSVRNREMDPDEKENDFDQISEEEFPSVKPHQHGSGTSYFNASVPRGSSSLRGWSNANSTQSSRVDSFDTFKWQKKMVSGGGFFSRKLFKDVGCSEDMIESLKSQHFSRPSHIQAMAYVPALEGKSCIIADQSGSGKTLAYLAPIIQRLRQEELQGLGKPSSSSPRVVILVPTAELASQVLNSCRSISKFGVPFRSMVATGGFRQKTQLDNLQQGLDVLIATPGRFMFLLQEGFLKLSDLKCAVLDEVDILFGDEGFERVLQSLLNLAPVTTQYLFVTATLPVDIYNKLVEVFPDCEAIMGPGVHRTSSGLEEVLVDCSGADGEEKTPETAFLNKKSALLRLVEENPVLKTIVFCNKIETCRKVENILKRLDKRELHIGVLPFHAALAQEVRMTNMKEFLNSQAKDSLFLISTDRASRGIDFSNVDHVVLFDFPRDPSEYVRRVGRTARGAGGKGKAFVFVIGKQVSLARRIMERNQKGHPLHDVPSAYELMS